MAVARYDSINTFLLPSGAYAALLWLPLLPIGLAYQSLLIALLLRRFNRVIHQ